MVGRDGELAVLGDVLAGVIGGRGRSVLIEGEPGIGKSALLTAGLEAVDGRGHQVLRGACDELGQRFPLSVMTQVLGVDVRSADPHRSAVARRLAQPRGGDSSDIAVGAGDPVAAASEELLALVDRLCAAGPVVLALEDLHWSDEATLAVWRRLSRASGQLPLLLVGTCRPVPERAQLELLQKEIAVGNEGILIALGPLGEESVRELAARQLGHPPGRSLSERLRAAAGNPLYVQESLDALVRSGLLREEAGAIEVASADAASSEISLATVIADHLDFLSRETHGVLRMATLLGPEFTVADLSALLEREPEEVSVALEEGLAARVLERIGAGVRFRHGLLKEALYHSMPMALRAALHRHAAQVMMDTGAMVERIAELILPVLETADGWELGWLAENAAVLAARAPALAAELIEHSLAHVASSDPRSAVLEDQLASVFFMLGRNERVEQLTRGILVHGSDGQRVGQAYWFLGYSLLQQGRVEDASAQLGAASSDARVTTLWRVRLTALQVMVGLREPSLLTEAYQAATAALEEAERLGDPVAMAYALHCLSVFSHNSGDSEAAAEQIARALALTEALPQLGDLRLLVMGNGVTTFLELDREEEALDTLREARDLAERTGSPRLAGVRIVTAERAYERGAWDDALAELDAVGEVPDEVVYPLRQRGLEALISVRQDDRDNAERQLEALADVTITPFLAYYGMYLEMARALDHERAGRVDEAAATLAPLVTSEYGEYLNRRSDGLPLLVRFALAAGDERLAREASEVCAQDAERMSQQPVKRAMALWCRGALQEDPALVLEGVQELRSVASRRFLLGDALEDAALLTSRCWNDVPRARELGAEALAVYGELGALADARRAAARLRAQGVRLGVRGPRQRPASGWEALTDTERVVAGLVAEDLSNPEIALRMRLSRRTVESHVSHILAKLEIRSRREITALVRG